MGVSGMLCTLVLRLAAPVTLFNFGFVMGRTRSPGLRGICRLLKNRSAEAQRALPDTQAENVRDMPKPNSATRGPPRQWINEHGPTAPCRSCNIRGIDDSKAVHTQRCRDRYAEFLRQSFNPDPILLDEHEKDLGALEVLEVVERAFQDPDGGDELPPMD